MKREGRQHGVVRSYPIPLSRQPRSLKTVDAAFVVGIFTKVSRKPTNHYSKFTGKCYKSECHGCHTHPFSKSKDKAKATMKLRSVIGADRELIGCSVGASAIDALAYLDSLESYDDVTVDDYDYNYDIKEPIGVEDDWHLVGQIQ